MRRSRASPSPGRGANPAAAQSQGTGVRAMAHWGSGLRAGQATTVQSVLSSPKHAEPAGSVGVSRSHHLPTSPGGAGGTVSGADSALLAGAGAGSSGVSTGGSTTAALRALEEFCNKYPVDNPSSSAAGPVVAPKLPSRFRTQAPSINSPPAMGGGVDGAGASSDPTAGSPSAATEHGAGSHTRGGQAEELRRAEREMHSQRKAKESAHASATMLRRGKIEEWAQIAEKHNHRLRRENAALAKIAKLTQEAMLVNDQRHEEALDALRAQVEYTALYRADDSDSNGQVRDSLAHIEDQVTEIRDVSERQVASELANVREAFDRQVGLRSEELAQARAAGQSTVDDWMKNCRELQTELESLLQQSDTAYERYKRLSRRHQRLRIENDAQSDDAVLLARQWALVTAQHERLKDRVQELELTAASERVATSASASPFGFSGEAMYDESHHNRSTSPPPPSDGIGHGVGGANNSEADQAQRLDAALQRAKALLSTEQQSLETVRTAHIAALKQRTELEVYLRCAVLRQQRLLAHQHYHIRNGKEAMTTGYATSANGTGKQLGTKSGGGGPTGTTDAATVMATSFTADDRRAVVEALVSVPRVLQLLYQATGSRAAKGATDAAARSRLRSSRRPTIGPSSSGHGGEDDGDDTDVDKGEAEDARANIPAAEWATDMISAGAPSRVVASVEEQQAMAAPDPAQDNHAPKMPGAGTDATTTESAMEQLWARWQSWAAAADTVLTKTGGAGAPEATVTDEPSRDGMVLPASVQYGSGA